uniref:Immunoglobulin domain-containing protein n=1 Tax=Pygocentrus nattereri TaxID=42514 RepID=A0A3B4CRZ3_PYGNA
MAMMLQLIFVLCTLISITVSSDVFRLAGSSVQLDVQDPVPDFDDLFWVFNRENNVLKYNNKNNIKYYSDYKGRVEFNEETYSLTLKNLQKTDSGMYEAKASGDVVTDVAEYRLSVLDPVEAPVLTHQLGTDTSNITLTCRGHDLSINSSCEQETCEEKEVTSPGGVSLSLFVNGSTIICNHSSPVSWKKDVLEMRELKRLCADEDPVEAPVLTHQLSRDTCNITLTCRRHDLSLNSSCEQETCEEKEVTFPGGVTLSLFVNGSTIICNHSNTVSWKTDVLEMRELKRLCADEDPVEAPVLTHQLSRDTCNITLTCRRHDLSLNSSCEQETCEEKEVTFPGGVTLSLFVNGSTIICNHSNTVSWKTDVLEMRELKRLCADEDPVEAPVLTHQLSRDTCNITLTCRHHDLSLNSSCEQETCEEKEVTFPGGVTLSLFVNGSTIICNHSNTVSWKTDVLEMRELKRLCADEDPVEAPVLTHQLSRDTCNITLTCRRHDHSLNCSCEQETCEEKEVTFPGGVTLSLSVNGSTIICNHSNPVSWKTDVLETRELKQLCVDEGESKEDFILTCN